MNCRELDIIVYKERIVYKGRDVDWYDLTMREVLPEHHKDILQDRDVENRLYPIYTLKP